jgi:hypothetical protein
VSTPIRPPRGLESLIKTVAGGADDDERDRRASTFTRGLALGALVGAAIAGSTIWQRRQTRPSPPPPTSGAAADDEGPTGPPEAAGASETPAGRTSGPSE